MFDYSSSSKAKIRVGYVMLDHVTNDLFKVVVELYTTISFSLSKTYSVGEIDNNEIRSEQT